MKLTLPALRPPLPRPVAVATAGSTRNLLDEIDALLAAAEATAAGLTASVQLP